MNHNPVGWFEIYVKDMERAKKFYESVFNVSLTQLPTPVPDIEMWSFPMVEDAGGVIHRAKTSIGEHGFIALAQDSEGNTIGLHSRK